MITKQTYKIGDSRVLMKELKNPVQLIITSCPYFDIMDYGAMDQIGYGQSLQEYLDDMQQIYTESFRVLDEGRRMCIVIADITRTKWSEGERNTGYLIPLTDLTTKICTSIGFQFLGRIIWNRVIAPKYMRNAMGSYPYPPNLWIKQEFDSILIYRKPGQPDLPPMKDRVGNEIPKKEWFEMVQPIWTIPPEGNRSNSDHPATFPNKIPHRLIKMFSLKGETVLDPFLGSGRTLEECRKLDRNGIGFELNRSHEPEIKRRIRFGMENIEGWNNER